MFITYLNFCLISVFFFSLLFRVLFRNVNVCLFLITLAHYWTLVCISLLICVLLIWGIYFGRVVTMKNGSDQVRCGKMLVTATCELAQWKKVIYWICSHIGRDWVCNLTKKKKTIVEPLTTVSIVNCSYFDRRLIRHEAGFLTDKSVFLFLQNAANITTLNGFRLSNMNKFTIRGFVVEYLFGFNPWIHETVLG